MYIGDLIQQTGASRKAIYLYESLGLIPTPQRQGSYRTYGPEVVGIIETIKCAQSLGFKLKELADALPPTSPGQPMDLRRIIDLVERKRRVLQQQLDTTKQQIKGLDTLRQRLQESPDTWACEATP